MAAAGPETPNRSAVNHCLNNFCRSFDLDLLVNEIASPAKQAGTDAHGIVKKVRFLYFSDRDALDRLVLRLSTCTPRVRTFDRKLQLLNEELQKVVDEPRSKTSPRRGTPRWPPPPPPPVTRPRSISPLKAPDLRGTGARPSQPEEAVKEQVDRIQNAADDMPPPSPTLAVKHLPRDSVTEAYGPAAEPPRLPHQAGTTSANTSFMSDGSKMNTSFISDSTKMTTSFMSDASKLSQSTTATSIYETCPGVDGTQLDGTQRSEFPMSSIAMSEADRLETMAMAEAQGTKANEPVVRDAPIRPSTPIGGGAPRPMATPTKRTPSRTSPSKPSPSKPSPAKPSPSKISPSKISEHHRIASVPRHGLAFFDLPSSLHTLSLDLQVEAYRVMRVLRLDPAEFEQTWRPQRTFASLYRLTGIPKNFQRGSRTDFNGMTLCARLRWSRLKDGPLFDLEMLPPREEDTTAFQRKFGGDRIMVLDLPALNKPPNHVKGQNVQDRLLEMFMLDQPFLGRKWLQYHVKDKKRRDAAEQDESESGTFQVAFFALSGPGLEEVSIAECLDWAVPFGPNANQAACKANARLDLAASRTRPTLTFEPHQMFVGVDDQYAQNMPDDNTYNDPDLFFPHLFDREKPLEMSDGCCAISVRAMQKVQDLLGLDYLPSVVQARIFGAKGIWYISASNDGEDPTPDDVWIKISKTQVKAKHDKQDMIDDAELRTLNVVNYSHPAKRSLLYPGFIPILLDRGVPAQVILDIARHQIEIDGNNYLEAIKDIRGLYRWVNTMKDVSGTRSRNGGIPMQAGLPCATDERVLQLVGAGFEPADCAFLKKEVLDVGEYVFKLEARQFKIHLNQSTSLIGICDPTGTLKPGEVHILLSSAFKDNDTGQSRSTLHGLEVLIARNPSLRNSDIQKARARFCPELAHLYDVVVFSAQGPRPLASKLSGGDYDGDTFWVTWQESLVQPFMNAPAPWAPRDYQVFGLTKDKVTLRDILVGPNQTQAALNARGPMTRSRGARSDALIPGQDSHDVKHLDAQARKWIQRSTADRMQQQYLGVVTLLHGKLTYAENDISSEKADMLVDLHDHLVDADKQGLRYTEDSYTNFKRAVGIPSYLPEPAYRVFTGNAEKEDGTKPSTKSPPTPNPRNVVDQMYFGIVEPEVQKAIKQARATMKYAKSLDADLTALYEDLLHSQSSIIQEELLVLKFALSDMREQWSLGMRKYHSEGRKRNDWGDCIQQCRDTYLEIMPNNTDSDTVIEWLRKRGRSFTGWEEIKASALSRLQHGSDGSLMFSIAGTELCHLKAQAQPPEKMRSVRLEIYLLLKPHKRKIEDELKEIGLDEEAENEYDHEADFDVGESLFDGVKVAIDDAGPGAMKAEPITPSKPPSRKRKLNDLHDVRRNGQGPPPVLSSSPSDWLVDRPPGKPRTRRHDWQEAEGV